MCFADGKWNEVILTGLERGVVDCVARSTVCPRWDGELVGGAIVGDRGLDVKFVCDSEWEAEVGG